MATKAYEKTSGCTFRWKIENIIYCCWKREERIHSPSFIADSMEGTKCSLILYPSGSTNERYVGLYLCTENDCVNPDVVRINYQLAILAKDDSILIERIESKVICMKLEIHGFFEFEERNKIFFTHKNTFIPDDTMTVQCTIWNTEKAPLQLKNVYARTVLKMNRRSFVLRIDKFSDLESGIINKFKDELIDFDLILNKGIGLETKFFLNINSFEGSIKIFSFKISIVDSKGKQENFKTREFLACDLKRGLPSILLFTKKFMENKSRYFPNDVLSLDCEYVSSNADVLYEDCGYGISRYY